MNTWFNKWKVQANKGFLELAILEVVNQSDGAYGVQIAQELKSAGIDIKEGSLYPLLNRMDQNDWLDSNWRTPDGEGGHPKRVYQITEIGSALLPKMRASFDASYASLKRITN